MNAQVIDIRQEQPADFASIRKVVASAFESDAEADLVEAIRASAHYVPEMALVAEVHNAVVGHVMISGATLRSDAGDRRIVMLAPLAVAPAHQRAGIGSALVRAGIAIAARLGEPLVILEGSPAYYGRFGFEHSLLHGIEITLPEWAPPEAAQILRLPNYDPNLTGLAVYPPAFDGVA